MSVMFFSIVAFRNNSKQRGVSLLNYIHMTRATPTILMFMLMLVKGRGALFGVIYPAHDVSLKRLQRSPAHRQMAIRGQEPMVAGRLLFKRYELLWYSGPTCANRS
jgi:hypothetical protein